METCDHYNTPGYTPPIEYFYTPLGRFLLFRFFTLGLYDIYWFYKNWIAIKKATGIRRIYPILRSLFAIFFCWSLFKKIHGNAGKYGYKYQNLAHIASFIFIGSRVILFIFGKITILPEAILGALVLMLSIPHIMAIIITQRAIKFHNKHAIAGYSTRRKLTGFEWICVVLGCLWWSVCVGLYLFFMHVLA